jgi:parallel beta-helix repeat protein
MVASISNIVEVDPARGNDSPAARPNQPYKTITAALADLRDSTLIKLAPGLYTQASGERFPITLRGGAILDATDAGQDVIISGAGAVDNFGSLVALMLKDGAQLRSVTVRNSRGSGILVMDGHSLIRNCLIHRCPQDGIVVIGNAIAQILSTRVEDNGGQSVRFTRQAKGVVEDCHLLRCQTGLYIGDEAAPLIRNNQISNHQVGILANGTSRPILRNNRVIQNQQQGLLIQGNSQPDLGLTQDPAGNIIRHNGQADIRNDTPQSVITVGNDLLPQRLQGAIVLTASQIPDASAVPPLLLNQPTSSPSPTSSESSSGQEAPSASSPGATRTRFADVQGHWTAPYIAALADRGLVKGYEDGSFRPDAVINRAQFAAMVAAAFKDRPLLRSATRFVDVPGNHWASNAITQAQRQGFLSGFPDQTFRPDQPMVRVQAVIAVAQGLKLPPAPANVLTIYRDRAQIPSYGTDAMAAATQQKLVVNAPNAGQLRPLEPMTRGEVATLIYQGLVAEGEASPLSASDPVNADMPQGSFPDIQGHWAEEFIQALLNRNLIRGYDDGRFYPDRPMTRAQFAAVIQEAFQPSPQRSAGAFLDVPGNHWAARAIQATYRGGFLSGFPDGRFGPDSNLLRVQIWVALINGLDLLPRQRGNPALLSTYVDRQAIPSYALDAMAKATQLTLVVNAPDIQTLNPNQTATRADVAAVVYQTLVQLQRAPRLHHPFIVKP